MTSHGPFEAWAAFLLRMGSLGISWLGVGKGPVRHSARSRPSLTAAPCWLVRVRFVGGVSPWLGLEAGVPAWGDNPASNPPSWPFQDVGGQPSSAAINVPPKLSEGHLAHTQKSSQHVPLDSAPPSVGVSPWGLVRRAHGDARPGTPTAASFLPQKSTHSPTPLRGRRTGQAVAASRRWGLLGPCE